MKLKDVLEKDETTYQIVDIKTKENVGNPSNNRRRLQTKADKLDSEYGAVRYIVKANRPVQEDLSPLRNQHDLRHKAQGLIAQAQRLLAKKRGIQPNPSMVYDAIKNHGVRREELEAVRTMLHLA